MKVLIVEDEIIAANRIKEMLLIYDSDIDVIGVIDSIVDTINFFIENESEIDLILMDIQLADGICFEIFEEIEIKKPIIFITAYDQYTLKAFKVNSIDYLLKPIEANEFFRSLDNFKSLHYKVSNIEKLQSLFPSSIS